MTITERQKEILNRIVKEYIDLAQPVSSQLLEKKYDFGICPATIRIEMQKLTDKGFLYQPHTSAGRVPTDRGYRFFVDNLFEKEFKELEIEDWFEEEIEDTVKFIQSVTKNLAQVSHTLTLNYLEKEKVFWKEGWEEILKEPEFSEKDFIRNFTNLLRNLENHIEELEINSGIKVYIGKETPFPKAGEFSIISSRYRLPKKEEGIISLLGPKRMAYDKNINLMNCLIKTLESYF